MLKTCEKCFNKFKDKIKIDGKLRNLKNRKFCFDCSPFLEHNTKDLTKFIDEKKICEECKKNKTPEEFYTIKTKKCKRCVSIYHRNRQRETKKKCVEYKGGKCIYCGYNKSYSALDFHHLDRTKKDFAISDFKLRSFENLKAELDKCDLVCANCHREQHDKDHL